MTRLLSLIVLLILAIPLLAQDQGFESYVYQSNPLCEFQITLSSAGISGNLTYHLTFDGATAEEGTMGANASIEMRLPVSQQWFVLVVERDAADKGLYSVKSGLACDDAPDVSEPPDTPQEPIIETPVAQPTETLLEPIVEPLAPTPSPTQPALPRRSLASVIASLKAFLNKAP